MKVARSSGALLVWSLIHVGGGCAATSSSSSSSGSDDALLEDNDEANAPNAQLPKGIVPDDYLVLSERTMKLTKTSAELSALAYADIPPDEGYDHFGFYDAEPDQAIAAQRNGYCFAAFRGTPLLSWDDWQQ
jgi:hypothetical protein